MPSAKLPPEQAAVLAHLFNTLPCGEEANTFDFCLTGDFAGRMYAAELPLTINSGFEGCSVVSTLATHAPHAFLAMTKSLAMETARVLANLEEVQCSGDKLGEGHSVSFPEWSNQPLGNTSVVMAKPTVVPRLGLPASADIQGRHVHFWLALPCTALDLQDRKALGPNAFITHLLAVRRPVFHE